MQKLTSDLEQAIQQSQGVLRVVGEQQGYVLMTEQAYRELAGVGTPEEMHEALLAIQAGLADIEAGRTRPFRDVLRELRHDSQS